MSQPENDDDHRDSAELQGAKFEFFSNQEYDRLAQALNDGQPEGFTEFEAQQFVEWAEKTMFDFSVLKAILAGQLNVRDVQHSIEETCSFGLVKP